MNKISNRLLIIRGKKTQVEFAKELGFEQTYISKYERGEVKPGIEFLNALIKQLNVNINWILTGEGSIYNKPEKMNSDQQTDQLISRIRELETELNNMKAAIKNIIDKSEKPGKHSKKNYNIPLNNYSNIIFN